ncbi:MAG TPA: hypothetical protein VH280_05560 [Verrucomicrobiae bacterium]|nr:hypothetical protein [Verrucomicrobiae bacterium]
MPLTALLLAIRDIALLLHKLDQRLEGQDAKKFLSAMQSFFYGWNLLTEGGNENLHFGTELLLRVLSFNKNDLPYTYGKLGEASGCFERFRELAGYPYPIYPVNSKNILPFEMQQIYHAVAQMAEASAGLAAYDSLLLRLAVAILEYGQLWSAPKPEYPAIGPNLHHALREYLSYSLRFRLGVSLPDIIDNASNDDVKADCEYAWTRLSVT